LSDLKSELRIISIICMQFSVLEEERDESFVTQLINWNIDGN